MFMKFDGGDSLRGSASHEATGQHVCGPPAAGTQGRFPAERGRGPGSGLSVGSGTRTLFYTCREASLRKHGADHALFESLFGHDIKDECACVHRPIDPRQTQSVWPSGL